MQTAKKKKKKKKKSNRRRVCITVTHVYPDAIKLVQQHFTSQSRNFFQITDIKVKFQVPETLL